MTKSKEKPRVYKQDSSYDPYDNSQEMKDWGFDDTHCHNCGIHNGDIEGYLMQCARCKQAYYCTMKCFNEHLPVHMEHCNSGALGHQPERRHQDLPKRQQDDPNGEEKDDWEYGQGKQRRRRHEDEEEAPKRRDLLGFDDSSSNSDSSESTQDWDTESEEDVHELESESESEEEEPPRPRRSNPSPGYSMRPGMVRGNSFDNDMAYVESESEEENPAPRRCSNPPPGYSMRPGMVRGNSFDNDMAFVESDEEEESENSGSDEDESPAPRRSNPPPGYSMRPGMVRGNSFDNDMAFVESDEESNNRGAVESEEEEEESPRPRSSAPVYSMRPGMVRGLSFDNDRALVDSEQDQWEEEEGRRKRGGMVDGDQWEEEEGRRKRGGMVDGDGDEGEYYEEGRVGRGRNGVVYPDKEKANKIRYGTGQHDILPAPGDRERERVPLQHVEHEGAAKGGQVSEGSDGERYDPYDHQRRSRGGVTRDDEDEMEGRTRRGTVRADDEDDEVDANGNKIRRYENGRFDILPESPKRQMEKVDLRQVSREELERMAGQGAMLSPRHELTEKVDLRHVPREELERMALDNLRRHELTEKPDLRHVPSGELERPQLSPSHPNWAVSSPLRTTPKGEKLRRNESLRGGGLPSLNLSDGMASISDFGAGLDSVVESPKKEKQSLKSDKAPPTFDKPEFVRRPVLRTTSKGARLKKQGSVRIKNGRKMDVSEDPEFVRKSVLRTTSKGEKARTVGNLAKPVTNIRVTVENGQIHWEQPDWARKAPLRRTSKGKRLKRQESLRHGKGKKLGDAPKGEGEKKEKKGGNGRKAPLRTTSKGVRLAKQGSVRVKKTEAATPADLLAQMM